MKVNPTLSPRRRRQALALARECHHTAIDPEVKAENLGSLFEALGGIASRLSCKPMAPAQCMELRGLLNRMATEIEGQGKQETAWKH